jgi:hypothetical protein
MVPERDSGALADAIGEVLALPAAERERMGAAGRRFVLGHCALRVEAEKLSSLLERARG